MKSLADYISDDPILEPGIFEQPERLGFVRIRILHVLWGQPWDGIAMGVCWAMRPAFLIATPQYATNRVFLAGCLTVALTDDHRTILFIDYDAQVGLTDETKNGTHLQQILRERGLAIP